MNRKSSIHHAYAGPTTCLRCDREFHSWDRRQNRLCAKCLEYLNGEPSDEHRYSLPTRRDISRRP
jgi:hypothetical protein